jgi:hypothetical protein
LAANPRFARQGFTMAKGVVIVLAILALACAVHAATFRWLDSSSTEMDWATASNW